MENARVVRLGTRFKEAGASGKKAHIISRNGKWAIFREGTDEVVATFRTKASAMKGARRMVLNGKSDRIVVHRADGSVEKVQLVNQ
jgi:hypothetical protein